MKSDALEPNRNSTTDPNLTAQSNGFHVHVMQVRWLAVWLVLAAFLGGCGRSEPTPTADKAESPRDRGQTTEALETASKPARTPLQAKATPEKRASPADEPPRLDDILESLGDGAGVEDESETSSVPFEIRPPKDLSERGSTPDGNGADSP